MDETSDCNHPTNTLSELKGNKMTMNNYNEWAGPEHSSKEQRNDEDNPGRKSTANYTTSGGTNLTADAHKEFKACGVGGGGSVDNEEDAMPITLDIMNLSHHSLDLDLGLGLFSGEDGSFGDGELSVSSFRFHDSQEQVDHNLDAKAADQPSNAPISLDIQGEPSGRFAPDGDITSTVDSISMKEISSIIQRTRGDSNGNDIDPSHQGDKGYSDSKDPISFDGRFFATADLPTAAGILSENPFHTTRQSTSETESKSVASSGTGNTHDRRDSLRNGDSLVYSPNPNSAQVSAASVRTDAGNSQDNESSSAYLFPNTVQVQSNTENGVPFEETTASRSFMQDTSGNQENHQLSDEEKIRQQHMQSYMKWQEEHFPISDRMSQRRIPRSMFKERPEFSERPEFAAPTPRSRQERRFSMPTFSSTNNYNAQDSGDTNWPEKQPEPLEDQNNQVLDQASSAYSYSLDNGEGPVPIMNRKRQDRRFSMPTISSSTNGHDPDFHTHNVYDLDPSAGNIRRRQQRRLSNESLSSSVHDHVAHMQGNMQESLDGAAPSRVMSRRFSNEGRRFSNDNRRFSNDNRRFSNEGRRFSNDSSMQENPGGAPRRFSRRFSNETISVHSADIAFARSMQRTQLINQQGGLQFFTNSAEGNMMPNQGQGRRFSMPNVSTNFQDLPEQAAMRFQARAMSAGPGMQGGPSSLLLPITAVSNQQQFMANAQMNNCSMPGMDGMVDKSKSLSHMPSFLDIQQDFGSNCVISAADRELATDFSFAVLTEVESCTFGKQDRTGKRRSLPLGFQGLACRHCRGLSKIGGRLFPSTIKTMSDTNKTLMALYNHLIKCPVCPNNKKRYLQYLKESHDEERKNKRYGSQKALFSKIWKRLHGKCPPV